MQYYILKLNTTLQKRKKLNDFEYSNLINIAALLIGLQNLYENEQQTAYNDVHASNQKQAEYLLGGKK